MLHFFGRPEWLWLWTVLIPLAAWSVRGRQRRVRAWAALGQGSRPQGNGAWAGLGAIGCLILALSQPRWGRVAGPPLPPGQDVVLVVDTSLSMAAEDAIPNRLGVAVEAAESVVRALGSAPGDRAAVVAFAGRGVLRCPLTENLGAVIEALHALHPGDVQPRGTDLAAALDAALDAFDDREHAGGRSVALCSDGEDLSGTWQTAPARLRQAGVVVHAIAIGDPAQGHPLPVGPDSAPLTYQGQPVFSRRSDAILAALARATGGAVVRLGLAAADLGSLYESRIAPVARRRREVLSTSERKEQYPAFVLGALALGLAGSWPGRRGWRRGATAGLAILALASLTVGAGPVGETPTQVVAAGRFAYEKGDFAAALAAFERAITLEPNSAVPRYDAAATLYQIGRYADASTRYREARDRAGPGLRTKIDYALGNSALALGDIAAALHHYDSCLASRVPGAVYDAVRGDAAINRQFAVQQANRLSQAPDEQPPTGASQAPRSAQHSDQGPGQADSGRPAPSPRDEQIAPQSRRQAPVGSGERSPAPPRVGTPEDQLARALRNVREARRRRLVDTPPPLAASSDRKEW